MSGGAVVDDDGVLWWTAAHACEQLGVAPRNLHDWVRRSARDPGFARVDRPRRRGRTAAYRAEQLLEAEVRTAAATRGRRRGGVT